MQWETVEGEALEELLASQAPKGKMNPASYKRKNQAIGKSVEQRSPRAKSRQPKTRGGRPRTSNTGPATAPAS